MYYYYILLFLLELYCKDIAICSCRNPQDYILIGSPFKFPGKLLANKLTLKSVFTKYYMNEVLLFLSTDDGTLMPMKPIYNTW